uniref:AMP-dependent synthetase/ligase domain-containing protein n=1 Tax=Aegilops tauschii subsp. strangulata TaxID=200361 RepID=A0A453Q1J4_AEGTS
SQWPNRRRRPPGSTRAADSARPRGPSTTSAPAQRARCRRNHSRSRPRPRPTPSRSSPPRSPCARRRRHRHCRLLPVLHRLRPGDVALVVAPSRLEVPVLHVALMSIGTVVSPANPASTPEEYAHQVALSRPVVAFAAPEVAAKLPGHVRCVVFGSDAQESLSSAGAKAAPPPAVTLLPLPLFNVFGFMMVLRSHFWIGFSIPHPSTG